MSENEQHLEIINRIKSLYKKGESDRAFALRCGIPQTTFSGYTTGNRRINVENLYLISLETGVSVDWILTGDGPIMKGRLADPSNISAGPQLQRIPIISWVQAGEWTEVVDQFQPGYADEWTTTTATRHPNAFALMVHGDSMEPEFREGDIITIDPGRDAINGAYVIAKNGDEATFKQLVLDGSSVFLKPLNSRYPIKDMTGVEFRIIGVVVAKEKRY